jgi:hypothetical protein
MTNDGSHLFTVLMIFVKLQSNGNALSNRFLPGFEEQ